jgi:hypothetical protein
MGEIALEVAVEPFDAAFNRGCSAVGMILSYGFTGLQSGSLEPLGSLLAPAPIPTVFNQCTTRLVIPFIQGKIN